MTSQALPTDLLASLYAGNPDAIAVYDCEGRLVACNATALALSGQLRMESLRGTHFSEHVYGEDVPRALQAFQAALSGLTDHIETTIRDHQGRIIPVEVHLFAARSEDRIIGVFAQARDRLALLEAERSLGLNQERFRSLFEYHPDAIMSLKSDGRISRVNVGLETITGFYGEQLINKPWTELIAPECRGQACDAFALASSGEAGEFDSLLLDRLGNRIDVQLKLVPLRVGEAIEGRVCHREKCYGAAPGRTCHRLAGRAYPQTLFGGFRHGASPPRVRSITRSRSAAGSSVSITRTSRASMM